MKKPNNKNLKKSIRTDNLSGRQLGKEINKGVSMKNPQSVFLIIIVALALVFGGYLLAPPTDTANKQAANNPEETINADPQIINNSDAPLIGKAEAKVKLIVFSDYECPYCKNAHEILNSLYDKYPDDVNIQVRNFIVHPTSEILARAAEAANLQGKFKQMNDSIFAKGTEANEDAVVALAKEIGLNIDKFKSDLNSDKVKNRVSKDNEDAMNAGLSGTPSLFMDNESISNFNAIEQLVKEKLGK